MKYRLNPAQEEWVQALESGKYQQGRRYLHTARAAESSAYCCLGVACVIYANAFPGRLIVKHQIDGPLMVSYDDEYNAVPPVVRRHLGLRSGYGGFLRGEPAFRVGTELVKSLSTANDFGVSFRDIAAFIRSNPELVFEPDSLIVDEIPTES